MNSPWHVLSKIRATDSKNEKIALIQQEAAENNEDFFAGIRYAFDNIDTFGVKKVPNWEGFQGPSLSFSQFSILANKLIKRELTGHLALDAIRTAMLNSSEEEWDGWYALILRKDLKAGFSESSVNKAIKDTHLQWVIPTTPYMRCSLPAKSNMEDWDWTKGVYSQTKADGMFANVNVREDGYVWVTSRGGTLFPDGCLGIETELVATFDVHTRSEERRVGKEC